MLKDIRRILVVVLMALLVIFGIVALVSCTDQNGNIYDSKAEANHVVSRVVRFGYDGHDYILFYTYGKSNVIHDPDCHCLEK